MRGYQKRVIYLKNTGSSLFEEAYFVLSPDGESAGKSCDMVNEANRIIEENFGRKKKRGVGRVIFFPLSFLLGGAFSSILFLIIKAVF